MMHCFPSHTQITWYVPKIYCPSKTLRLAVWKHRNICLDQNRRGANAVLFPSEQLWSCSEEEQELHPTHPIHLMTALGHNKIRTLVVRGSGSSYDVLPWCQHQVLSPFSETKNPHTLFPCCQEVQAAEMLQTNELPMRLVWSHQLTHPTPWCPQALRHIHYLYCIVAEVFKGLDLTKCPLSFPYAFSGCWASEVNLRPQFSSCVLWL